MLVVARTKLKTAAEFLQQSVMRSDYAREFLPELKSSRIVFVRSISIAAAVPPLESPRLCGLLPFFCSNRRIAVRSPAICRLQVQQGNRE